VVLPALVAALPLAGEAVDGRAFVTATVLGYDIGRRVMMGFGGYVAHNSAGWHSTGTCGVFAAAAAVASLLRLDAGTAAHALGLAASFSSGLWGFIHDGAMAKRVHAGRAAEGGLLAVLLAQDGVTGPAYAFEDMWGSFLKTYGRGSVEPDALTSDLGRDWLMRHAAIKPYASCRDTHAAVDALERVVTLHNLQADAVASIRVRLNAFLEGMVGGRDVFNLPAAQMSLPYAAAARLLFGTAGLGAYSAERRSSPAVAELLPRITVDIDDTVTASWHSSIVVETRDGRRIEEPTTAPLGSPENPLPPDRLRAKFDELARVSLPAEQADRLAEFALNLDNERDATALPALLRTRRAERPLSKGGLPNTEASNRST
jgi:2-methylcitrate dehydratase PrpD